MSCLKFDTPLFKHESRCLCIHRTTPQVLGLEKPALFVRNCEGMLFSVAVVLLASVVSGPARHGSVVRENAATQRRSELRAIREAGRSDEGRAADAHPTNAEENGARVLPSTLKKNPTSGGSTSGRPLPTHPNEQIRSTHTDVSRRRDDNTATRVARQQELAEFRVARQTELSTLQAAREHVQDDAEISAAESSRVAAVVDLRNRLLEKVTLGVSSTMTTPPPTASLPTPSNYADVGQSRNSQGLVTGACHSRTDDCSTGDSDASRVLPHPPLPTNPKRPVTTAQCTSNSQCGTSSFCTIQGKCEETERCARSLSSPDFYPINDVCPPPRGSRSSPNVPKASTRQTVRQNQNQSSVVHVDVCIDDCISGITFTYRDKTRVSWGSGSTCTVDGGSFDVPLGQYLSSIKVRAPAASLSGVQFITNKGATSPWFGQWDGRLAQHKASKGYEIWGLDRGTDGSTCSPLRKVHERLAGLR
jgi:hypothetical protein